MINGNEKRIISIKFCQEKVYNIYTNNLNNDLETQPILQFNKKLKVINKIKLMW